MSSPLFMICNFALMLADFLSVFCMNLFVWDCFDINSDCIFVYFFCLSACLCPYLLYLRSLFLVVLGSRKKVISLVARSLRPDPLSSLVAFGTFSFCFFGKKKVFKKSYFFLVAWPLPPSPFPLSGQATKKRTFLRLPKTTKNKDRRYNK